MSIARVACHVHSDWSYDGQWALDRLAAEFSRRGYDAVLMAEHDRGFDQRRWEGYRVACAEASRGITLVPGIEYSDPTNTIHVPVWGDIPFVGDALETPVMLERVASEGGLAVLAHPSRRDALTKLDPGLIDSFVGVEIWNRKYDGYSPNRKVAELLGRRPGIVPFVSLDFHSARQFHPLAMNIEVHGPAREASICNALRDGRAHGSAFRVPAMQAATGPLWPVLNSLEAGRRGLAPYVRQARRARGGGP